MCSTGGRLHLRATVYDQYVPICCVQRSYSRGTCAAGLQGKCPPRGLSTPGDRSGRARPSPAPQGAFPPLSACGHRGAGPPQCRPSRQRPPPYLPSPRATGRTRRGAGSRPAAAGTSPPAARPAAPTAPGLACRHRPRRGNSSRRRPARGHSPAGQGAAAGGRRARAAPPAPRSRVQQRR